MQAKGDKVDSEKSLKEATEILEDATKELNALNNLCSLNQQTAEEQHQARQAEIDSLNAALEALKSYA